MRGLLSYSKNSPAEHNLLPPPSGEQSDQFKCVSKEQQELDQCLADNFAANSCIHFYLLEIAVIGIPNTTTVILVKLQLCMGVRGSFNRLGENGSATDRIAFGLNNVSDALGPFQVT